MTGLTGTALGQEAARRLAERHRDIQPGLTTVELDRAEQRYGFEFAEDHRAFLSVGLPVGGSNWPDWRNGDPDDLRARLCWPVEGVLFDVEHNVYWHRQWGQRPTEPAAAVGLARVLSTVPRLVPVYSHRYLPAGRGSFGHPVLSMYQTDIIYYGDAPAGPRLPGIHGGPRHKPLRPAVAAGSDRALLARLPGMTLRASICRVEDVR